MQCGSIWNPFRGVTWCHLTLETQILSNAMILVYIQEIKLSLYFFIHVNRLSVLMGLVAIKIMV